MLIFAVILVFCEAFGWRSWYVLGTAQVHPSTLPAQHKHTPTRSSTLPARPDARRWVGRQKIRNHGILAGQMSLAGAVRWGVEWGGALKDDAPRRSVTPWLGVKKPTTIRGAVGSFTRRHSATKTGRKMGGKASPLSD